MEQIAYNIKKIRYGFCALMKSEPKPNLDRSLELLEQAKECGLSDALIYALKDYRKQLKKQAEIEAELTKQKDTTRELWKLAMDEAEKGRNELYDPRHDEEFFDGALKEPAEGTETEEGQGKGIEHDWTDNVDAEDFRWSVIVLSHWDQNRKGMLVEVPSDGANHFGIVEKGATTVRRIAAEEVKWAPADEKDYLGQSNSSFLGWWCRVSDDKQEATGMIVEVPDAKGDGVWRVCTAQGMVNTFDPGRLDIVKITGASMRIMAAAKIVGEEFLDDEKLQIVARAITRPYKKIVSRKLAEVLGTLSEIESMEWRDLRDIELTVTEIRETLVNRHGDKEGDFEKHEFLGKALADADVMLILLGGEE